MYTVVRWDGLCSTALCYLFLGPLPTTHPLYILRLVTHFLSQTTTTLLFLSVLEADWDIIDGVVVRIKLNLSRGFDPARAASTNSARRERTRRTVRSSNPVRAVTHCHSDFLKPRSLVPAYAHVSRDERISRFVLRRDSPHVCHFCDGYKLRLGIGRQAGQTTLLLFSRHKHDSIG